VGRGSSENDIIVISYCNRWIDVLMWREKEKGERIVHGRKPQRSREATGTFNFGQNGITKDICDHPQRGVSTM